MKQKSKEENLEKDEYAKEMLDAGYSMDAIEAMYENKVVRDRAIKRNEDGASGLQKYRNDAIIRNCDKKEREIKRKDAQDWKDIDPHRYALFLINDVNNLLNLRDAETNEKRKAKLDEEIEKLQNDNDEWRLAHLKEYEEAKNIVFGNGNGGKEKDVVLDNGKGGKEVENEDKNKENDNKEDGQNSKGSFEVKKEDKEVNVEKIMRCKEKLNDKGKADEGRDNNGNNKVTEQKKKMLANYKERIDMARARSSR